MEKRCFLKQRLEHTKEIEYKDEIHFAIYIIIGMDGGTRGAASRKKHRHGFF